ncbi:MAG: hypothetical protein NT060_00095, partial [Candidatus Omnitrophica bacterium]|nr:hypothetical protein [Candidatus Omnitrophota bacterium]
AFEVKANMAVVPTVIHPKYTDFRKTVKVEVKDNATALKLLTDLAKNPAKVTGTASRILFTSIDEKHNGLLRLNGDVIDQLAVETLAAVEADSLVAKPDTKKSAAFEVKANMAVVPTVIHPKYTDFRKTVKVEVKDNATALKLLTDLAKDPPEVTGGVSRILIRSQDNQNYLLGLDVDDKGKVKDEVKEASREELESPKADSLLANVKNRRTTERKKNGLFDLPAEQDKQYSNRFVVREFTEDQLIKALGSNVFTTGRYTKIGIGFEEVILSSEPVTLVSVYFPDERVTREIVSHKELKDGYALIGKCIGHLYPSKVNGSTGEVILAVQQDKAFKVFNDTVKKAKPIFYCNIVEQQGQKKIVTLFGRDKEPADIVAYLNVTGWLVDVKEEVNLETKNKDKIYLVAQLDSQGNLQRIFAIDEDGKETLSLAEREALKKKYTKANEEKKVQGRIVVVRAFESGSFYRGLLLVGGKLNEFEKLLVSGLSGDYAFGLSPDELATFDPTILPESRTYRERAVLNYQRSKLQERKVADKTKIEKLSIDNDQKALLISGMEGLLKAKIAEFLSLVYKGKIQNDGKLYKLGSKILLDTALNGNDALGQKEIDTLTTEFLAYFKDELELVGLMLKQPNYIDEASTKRRDDLMRSKDSELAALPDSVIKKELQESWSSLVTVFKNTNATRKELFSLRGDYSTQGMAQRHASEVKLGGILNVFNGEVDNKIREAILTGRAQFAELLGKWKEAVNKKYTKLGDSLFYSEREKIVLEDAQDFKADRVKGGCRKAYPERNNAVFSGT